MNYLLRKLMSRVYRDENTDDGSNNGGGSGGIADDGSVIGTGNDARVAMLANISDNVDRDRSDELADVNDDGSTSQFLAPDPVSTEEDAEAIAAREAEETEAARLAAEMQANGAEDPPSKPQTIIVNGKEVALTPELVAKAQKIAAGDVYLQEAARLRNELSAKSQPSQKDVEAATLEDEIALARAIQMGTEEEAVAAIRKLQKAGPSQDDIARTIDERLTFKEAIGKFRSDYSDILSDPVLHKLALDRDAELLNGGDSRPYYERYKEIGDGIRSWVNSKAPAAATPTPTNTQADKVARKAAASPTPTVANGKAANTVVEEKEESTQDVISGIAKARGGPQWMNGAPR